MQKRIIILIICVVITIILFVMLGPKLVSETSWDRIKFEFARCNVTGAMQSHGLDVSVTLKDGTTIKAKEPEIDAIDHLVDTALKNCGTSILFGTE